LEERFRIRIVVCFRGIIVGFYLVLTLRVLSLMLSFQLGWVAITFIDLRELLTPRFFSRLSWLSLIVRFLLGEFYKLYPGIIFCFLFKRVLIESEFLVDLGAIQ
jgi:hypothetical protein